MRIFIDCHIFDYGFQGTRTYVQGLYLEMVKDKTKHFYFAASDIENLQTIFGKADNISYLKYRSESKFYRLLIDIPLLIKKNKIDFAHFQYVVPPIKFCKYIVSTHDVLFLDYPEYFPKLDSLKNKILFGYSAKKSEIVFTGSEFSKQKIEKHFKINNVFVKVYGVESVFFDKYEKPIIKKEVTAKYGFNDYLIYISRHEPRKNHFRLLKAFIELKLYENYHLVLIGDTTFPDSNFDDLLENSNHLIKSKVVLMRKVAFKDMVLLLRGSNLSIYPSMAEGFGLPPLESVASKIPTLCSNTTSMGEFDFFEQDFINPLDFKEIKTKISKKLKENNLERLAELSKFVANKYNWEAATKSFKAVLSKY